MSGCRVHMDSRRRASCCRESESVLVVDAIW